MKYGLGDKKIFKILLLLVNDNMVGMMTYFDYFSFLYGKSAHIQCTFVKEDYRSIGIGRILNSYLINKLQVNNYNYLTINIDKEDKEAVERMQILDAALIKDTVIVEMENKTLRNLINL
jgi:GNAT superfamily N-acetyltransferase